MPHIQSPRAVINSDVAFTLLEAKNLRLTQPIYIITASERTRSNYFLKGLFPGHTGKEGQHVWGFLCLKCPKSHGRPDRQCISRYQKIMVGLIDTVSVDTKKSWHCINRYQKVNRYSVYQAYHDFLISTDTVSWLFGIYWYSVYQAYHDFLVSTDTVSWLFGIYWYSVYQTYLDFLTFGHRSFRIKRRVWSLWKKFLPLKTVLKWERNVSRKKKILLQFEL